MNIHAFQIQLHRVRLSIRLLSQLKDKFILNNYPDAVLASRIEFTAMINVVYDHCVDVLVNVVHHVKHVFVVLYEQRFPFPF